MDVPPQEKRMREEPEEKYEADGGGISIHERLRVDLEDQERNDKMKSVKTDLIAFPVNQHGTSRVAPDTAAPGQGLTGNHSHPSIPTHMHNGGLSTRFTIPVGPSRGQSHFRSDTTGASTRQEGQFVPKPRGTRDAAVQSSNPPTSVHHLKAYSNLIAACSIFPASQQDGKITPSRYGSTETYDLGLCFSTHATNNACQLGIRCPWNHDLLSDEEVAWILRLSDKGERFVSRSRQHWKTPQPPHPSAILHWVVTGHCSLDEAIAMIKDGA
ncbi:hypothetical protein P154DRAFT_529444 [Amniculicola lignicola CBS 123094]|uniref:Uncharacterized protein n=1 Tax=Amniculicola lignicola CBS 123094 TaxID=1392246 RepID=A0A6A5WZD3_9PLEO|nr:hypothetical protein P154DRAFT_529444 [Amniculicola lignicola CBS 123094]